MDLRKRTTKIVARRHDIQYFKHGSPIRLWQFRLAGIALLVAVLWIGLSAFRSSQAFSAGPISQAHSVFANQCDTCHKPAVRGAGFLPVGWGGGSLKVADSTCLDCHQVGPHHASTSVTNQSCSSCHIEHIGAMHLAAAPVKSCETCHSNLQLRNAAMPSVATHIVSFTQGHPNFRALRTASLQAKQAATGLKFNHAAHLVPNLLVPGGTTRTLNCASCHQVEPSAGRDPNHSGRMADVDFDRSCRSCHSLDFDRRVVEQAPHTYSADVLKFVQAKMAAAAPSDNAALVRAETILFRGKCALCHTVEGAAWLPNGNMAQVTGSPTVPQASIVSVALTTAPRIQPYQVPQRFFSSAFFSHTVHAEVGCTECHADALTSQSGKDFLMPSIATCQKCHDGQSRPQGPVLSAGHAESGCSECHGYHEGESAMKPQSFSVHQLTGQ